MSRVYILHCFGDYQFVTGDYGKLKYIFRVTFWLLYMYILCATFVHHILLQCQNDKCEKLANVRIVHASRLLIEHSSLKTYFYDLRLKCGITNCSQRRPIIFDADHLNSIWSNLYRYQPYSMIKQRGKCSRRYSYSSCEAPGQFVSSNSCMWRSWIKLIKPLDVIRGQPRVQATKGNY